MSNSLSGAPRVSLAPVQNILNTLALLNAPRALATRSPGLRKILAELTPFQRYQNRLLFEVYGNSLMPADEWPSFPMYVDFLAARDPEALRDQILSALLFAKPPAGATTAPASRAQRLAAVRGILSPPHPADHILYDGAFTLLQNPERLRATVVEHLRSMWTQFLSEDWTQLQPVLETLVSYVSQRLARQPDLPAAIRSLTGSGEGVDALAGMDAAMPAVVVISGHMQQSLRIVKAAQANWLFVGLQPHPAIWRRSPIERSELMVRLRPLAEASFLDILGLLTQHDELSAQELATALNLTQPTASRHLQQLVTAGHIMERRQGGATKVYRLTPGFIAQTMRALEEHLASADSGAAIAETPVVPLSPLQRFMDQAGRVTQWPSRRKDQVAVLAYLAAQFPPGENFTEKEVNARLGQFHLWNDPAFLRRELYEAHLLDRTRNGARYWRIAPAEVPNSAAPVT